MTAVVAILNKQAIAIAADSAVSISNSVEKEKRKILHKANKIFTLSKVHPVGLMIYNSGSFMSTPWETIIKIYRKKIGEASFPTIKEYKDDFLSFLRNNNYFTDEETQLLFLENFIVNVIDSILREAGGFSHEPAFLNKIEELIDGLISYWGTNTKHCEDFENYSFDMFHTYSAETLEKVTKKILPVDPSVIAKLEQVIYYILIAKENRSDFSGLIFTGFGEDEIYPQLCTINISIVVDDKLKCYDDDRYAASISNKNNAVICPFAQDDVIQTILTGIDPTLKSTFIQNDVKSFDKILKLITSVVIKQNPELASQIERIDLKPIIDELIELNRKNIAKNYTDPLINAVASLSKEDLAEMSESLIYLTSLKRRITFAEENVGGPVDVAIISKGDGFIWIKRKQYFKPELNQNFFNYYFKR
ncbi:hypothetical protein GVN16_09615 [Emticicia sp. CRIBPO]|uniref:hypothetical protein n=1 Tax=Emticicia sp. CRIBPO TaxID=2683258 RepID=UPI00141317DF|nr:hypothetical protein [Emticicia sp. CRIBPO]NBA86018.1 hypothetical protein [Emticicia sp. CRIBPO]